VFAAVAGAASLTAIAWHRAWLRAGGDPLARGS
jgi:hypothetical protein